MESTRHTHSRRLLVLLLSLVSLLAGCAAGSTNASTLRGSSGSIVWEVTDMRERLAPNGRELRWYYTLSLKETSGKAIQFETVERGAYGSVVGSSREYQFQRRLGPNSELRLYYWDGIFLFAHQTGNYVGSVPGGQQGMTVFRRFRGKDDAGNRVVADVRIDLNPGVGRRLEQPADAPLPPSTALSSGDQKSLWRRWRGYYRDDAGFAIPLEWTIAEGGGFEAAVDEPVTARFRGNVTIRNGRIAYVQGDDTGTFTLHRVGNEQVLAGIINGRREGQQPGTTHPFTYSVRLSAVPEAGAPSATSTPNAPGPGQTPTQQSVPSTQQAALPATTPSPGPTELLTNDGVLSLVKAGIDESVILLKIRQTAAAFDVGTDALVKLKQSGVSDRILEAMITKASSRP